MSPYLAKWLAFDEPLAADHLAQFLDENDDLENRRLANPFWGPDNQRAEANMRRVVRWAHAQPTLLAVVSASDRAQSDSEASAIQRCFTALTGNDAFGAGHLEQAVEANDIDRVGTLLDNGVDPDEVVSVTSTPVWEIAFNAGQDAMTDRFAKAGASIERADEPHAYRSRTPLTTPELPRAPPALLYLTDGRLLVEPAQEVANVVEFCVVAIA